MNLCDTQVYCWAQDSTYSCAQIMKILTECNVDVLIDCRSEPTKTGTYALRYPSIVMHTTQAYSELKMPFWAERSRKKLDYKTVVLRETSIAEVIGQTPDHVRFFLCDDTAPIEEQCAELGIRCKTIKPRKRRQTRRKDSKGQLHLLEGDVK